MEKGSDLALDPRDRTDGERFTATSATGPLLKELKLVMRTGCRPATLVQCMDKLPNIVRIVVGYTRAQDRDLLAIDMFGAVQRAVESFGDGPYGVAAGLLFGTDPQTRGLPLSRRRGRAAEALDVQLPTFSRWWQRRITEDVAVVMYAQCKHNED